MATQRRDGEVGIAKRDASSEGVRKREKESMNKACHSQDEALLAGIAGVAGASGTGDSTQHEQFLHWHAPQPAATFALPPAVMTGGSNSVMLHSRSKMVRASFTGGANRLEADNYLALGASASFLR